MPYLSSLPRLSERVLILVLCSNYFAVAMAPIKAVAAARMPPGDPTGSPLFGNDPHYAVFGAYDGAFMMVDTLDPTNTVELNRQRSRSFPHSSKTKKKD